jgi:hypothetical protein
MFLKDKSSFQATLTRSGLGASSGLAFVSVEVIIPEGSRIYEPAGYVGDRPTEWPITRSPIIKGVSVTASGSVPGSGRPPHETAVKLSLGRRSERIVVTGERFWRRCRDGILRASQPAPFDQIQLDYRLAFGGSVEVAPGIDRATGLPHPGYVLVFPSNPSGTGFYPDHDAAVDRPLPRIERACDRVVNATDRPVPGGLGPCPDLPALRSRVVANPNELTDDDRMRMDHHAPYALVTTDEVVGQTVSLWGCGPSVDVPVPPPPVRVFARAPHRSLELRMAPRVVHVDATRRIVLVGYQGAVRYERQRAPTSIIVSEA